MDIRERISACDAAEDRFEHDMESYGVLFEQGESSPRFVREHFDERCACHCENGGASVWGGGMDFPSVPGLSHGREHGVGFRRLALYEELLLLL